MAVINQRAPFHNANDTSLIIPKGLLNPNETIIIKIPSKMCNSGPLLVVKDGQTNGSPCFKVKPRLTPLEEGAEEHVPPVSPKKTTARHFEESELKKLMDSKPLLGVRRYDSRPATHQQSRSTLGKASMYDRMHNVSNVNVSSEVRRKSSCHRKSSNVFVTRPIPSEVAPAAAVSARIVRLPSPEDRLPNIDLAKSMPLCAPSRITKQPPGTEYAGDRRQFSYIKLPPNYTRTIDKLFPTLNWPRNPQGGGSTVKGTENITGDRIDNPLDIIRSRLYNVPVESRSPMTVKPVTKLKGSQGSERRSDNKAENVSVVSHRYNYPVVPVTYVV